VLPHGVLLFLAVLCAWYPAETCPWTPVLLSTGVAAILTWGVSSTRRETLHAWVGALALVLGFLGVSALSGLDRAGAVGQLGLALCVCSVLWLASRHAPPVWMPQVLGVALALLSVWAGWQLGVGFEQAQTALSGLPEHTRAAYEAVLTNRRGFASLTVPGHLAVLLATALFLLLSQSKMVGGRLVKYAGAVLCLSGLVLTRSLLVAGLAVLAGLGLMTRFRKSWIIAFAALLLVVLAGVVALRGDMLQLEPIKLRADNFKTAVWVWRTSPVSGVGLASFGQASLGIPFEVGNAPVHAHCLPLELVAELGVAGMALVVLAGVALLVVFVKIWAQSPAMACAVALVPCHNLADFSLYTSGVAIPWAVLAGWAWASARSGWGGAGSEPRAGARALTGQGRAFVPAGGCLLLTGALAAAVPLTVGHASSVVMERSAAACTDPEQAVRRATTAAAVAPWRLRPIELVVATALEHPSQERLATAWELLAHGRWLRPRSASLAELEAQLALRQQRIIEAVAASLQATQLRPGAPSYAATYHGLLEALDRDADARAR